MSVWEVVSTSFVEEDYVLDQEAEEWNDNLKVGKKYNHVTKIVFKEVILVTRQEPKQSRQHGQKESTKFSPVNIKGHAWS